jgi:hypothetical protein
MIYILTQQFMNGTVTMGITTLGIEAGNFEEAKGKVKKLSGMAKATVTEDDEETLCFCLPEVIGTMENTPLNII